MTTALVGAPVGARLDIGRVFSRTARLLWRLAPLLLAVGIATVGVASGFFEALRFSGLIAPDGDDVLKSMRGAPGENIVVGLAGLLFSGAAIFAAVGAMRDRPAGVRASFGAGARYFGRLFGIGFLSNLGIVLGLVLLIVPGLILWARWSAAAPAGVAEDRGVGESMDRSARLTEGSRARIILVGVVGGVVAVIAMVVLGFTGGLIDGILQTGGLVASFVAVPLVTVFFTALSAVGRSVIYDELVRAREGGASDDLSEVFA
jgi:hypothetical protein